MDSVEHETRCEISMFGKLFLKKRTFDKVRITVMVSSEQRVDVQFWPRVSMTAVARAVRIHSPEVNTVRSEQPSLSPVEFKQAVSQSPLASKCLWNWHCSVNTFTTVHHLISTRPSRLRRRTQWCSGENTGLYSGGLLFEQAVCVFPKTPHINARIAGYFY